MRNLLKKLRCPTVALITFNVYLAPLSLYGQTNKDQDLPPSISCQNSLHGDHHLATFDEVLESVMKESETSLESPLPPELKTLDQETEIQKHCEASAVCVHGEKPPRQYRLLHRLVLRSGADIWESVKAVRGRNLRANKVAFWDFIKNMAIIWPGQVFGSLKNGEPLSLETALHSPHLVMYKIPVTVLYHTLFMVWTQSDRGAASTPHVELPKPQNAKEFFVAVAKAYTGGEELNRKGYETFKRETMERFMGFASIIPLEVLHLSLITSLQVVLPEETQRLLYSGTLLTSADLPPALADKAIFATVFGLYLALKWSLISKPLDLRAIPMAREWMSRAYFQAKDQQMSPKIMDRAKHRTGFALEMIYRYGNSFVDGLVVIWFFSEGAPLIRKAIESLF